MSSALMIVGGGMWVVGGGYLWRPLTGHFAWWQANGWGQEHPDRFDWVVGGVLALFTIATLPALLVLLAVQRVLKATVGVNRLGPIGAEKRGLERIGRERLKEAEKEVGL
jgi:hypothetical protein